MRRRLIALAAIAVATGFTTAAQAQTVLTVSSWLPPTHTLSMAQKEWCDLLEKNTTGKIKCNILPRGVSPAPGTFDAVKNGLADMSYTVHGYTPGRFVLTQMAEVPFLGDKAEPLSVAFQRIASKHPEFDDEHRGRQGAGLLHPRPRHRVQHQAPHHQARRPAGPEVPRGRGHGQRDPRRWAMNVTLKPAPIRTSCCPPA
jgi:hypothetical protein